MDVTVGLIFLILGVLIVLTGILLAVGEVISGRHRPQGPRGRAMAGVNWEGIKGVLNAAAAVIKAMGDWKLPALFVLLGLLCMIMGVWILAARPIAGNAGPNKRVQATAYSVRSAPAVCRA
jgi:hypothetical protein